MANIVSIHTFIYSHVGVEHVRYFSCLRAKYLYIYFYHRTLSALPHDCLPTLEPGTRSRVSARYMARGDETPRAHQRGAPRGGDRSPRTSLHVCAEPLRLDVLWKPEALPVRWLGPPRTERVWGVASVARSRPGELLLAVIFFRFGRTRVRIMPISLHRVKRTGYWGKELQQPIV